MSDAAAMLFYLIGIVFVVAVILLPIIILWKFFEKAGRPGWASLIPIYNTYILIKIAGRSGWWLLLLLIPLVDIVILLIISIDTAKAFGRSTAFGVVGLFLFSYIGYAILAFGNDTYRSSEITDTTTPQPLYS